MPISFTRATWADYVGAPFLQASEVNRLETAIDALINGSSRAVYRDGDTITGNLTVNGWIESDGGYRDALGVTRVSSTGAGIFAGLTDSTRTAGRVLFTGTGGVHADSGSLMWDDTKKDFGVGVSRTIVGSTGATSESGEILIASGGYLDGLYCLRWDASNRVERIWFRVTAHAYDGNPQITILQYFSYNSAKVFQTLRIRASGDSATRYISVTVGNLNGSTAGINVVAMLLDSAASTGMTIGGTLPGGTTSVKTIVPDNLLGLASTLGADFDGIVTGHTGFAGWGTATSPAYWHIGQGAHDAARVGFASKASGDSFARWLVKENGLQEWGDGTGARDTNLYRSAANVLKTDDAFEAALGYRDAGGVTRISSTGVGTLASVTAADLTANLPVYADATKKLATESASAFRGRISAQAQDAKLDAISAGETAGRFWLGSYSAAINSYGMGSTTGKARFGNGVFLAIGASRTNLLRSIDFGATWTTVSPINGANTFSDVCWHSAASLWVAVGPSTCATSPDGVTWTMRTISADSWNGLASNGTTIIAVGAGCKVAYSTNGTSWTTVTPAGIPAAGFYSAYWSSVIGKFLAIGSGNVSISSNGSTWSTITNPGAGGGNWCTAVGNNFVAVDPSSGPYWSADGVTWGTPRRTPSAKANWQAIATNGAVAVIGGYSEETQAVSSDGEVWLPVDMGYTGSFNAVAYGGGWFVMLDNLGYCFRSRG